MAPENPADTAGPSSPPPRLPEGWLPQWEGVQRKWYYVQRATGKSQWEIPTEPVILTPSTTPTSIGTGPSQAPPSRPSTNSPPASGSRRIDEQTDFAAENLRDFSSLDAQLARQSGHPSHGASNTNWYTEQTGNYSVYDNGSAIDTAQRGHDSDSYTTNAGSSFAPFHPGHSDLQGSMGYPYMARASLGNAGDSSGNMMRGYSGVSGTGHGSHSFPPEHSSNAGPGSASHHLQWQAKQQQAASHAHTQRPPPQSGSLGYSQPFYNTYSTAQGAESALGSFVGHSLPPANPQHSKYAQQQAPYGTAVQQPSSHLYPSSSAAYSRYHSTSMGRTQSGPGVHSLGFPATPETQGNAQNYRNPLVEAGIQQYIPQQHTGYPSSGSVHPGLGHSHQAGPSRGRQDEWLSTNMPLRTAASDPQFISGPWASSTPPPGESPRAPRYQI